MSNDYTINAKLKLNNTYELDKFIKFQVTTDSLVYGNTVTLPGSMHNTAFLHTYLALLHT